MSMLCSATCCRAVLRHKTEYPFDALRPRQIPPVRPDSCSIVLPGAVAQCSWSSPFGIPSDRFFIPHSRTVYLCRRLQLSGQHHAGRRFQLFVCTRGPPRYISHALVGKSVTRMRESAQKTEKSTFHDLPTNAPLYRAQRGCQTLQHQDGDSRMIGSNTSSHLVLQDEDGSLPHWADQNSTK
jgi:hypothetical protein